MRALLYLHGWGGSKELWWGVLATMAVSHRGVALDLPGTGATPLPAGLRTMPQMATWVAQTCTRLGLPEVTLVGHSLGGNLAAQVALDFPALVRRLVLVDAALEPSILPRRAPLPLLPRLGLPALRLMRLASLPQAAESPWINPSVSGWPMPGGHTGTHRRMGMTSLCKCNYAPSWITRSQASALPRFACR